ncbi:hypothetical protein [Williamsia sterculiae]|nr:hypothetical protein [Williamsia sterculiae]
MGVVPRVSADSSASTRRKQFIVMQFFPVLVVTQCFVTATWALVMIGGFLLSRVDDVPSE